MTLAKDAFDEVDSQPTCLNATFSFPPIDSNNYRYFERYGGGSLWDQGAYDMGHFPSGEQRKNQYIAIRLNSQPFKRMSFSLDGQFDLSHQGEESSLEKYNLVMRYQLPFYLKKLKLL